MNVVEVMEKKKVLEGEVFKLLNDFLSETGIPRVNITTVHWTMQEVGKKEEKVFHDVRVNLEL